MNAALKEHPIATAVMPLIDQARERAEQEANRVIEHVREALSKNGGDVNIVAPRGVPSDPRGTYQRKMAYHQLVMSLTVDPPGSPLHRRRNEPLIRVLNPEAFKHFISAAKKDAAEQYLMFVDKLCGKVGSVVHAELRGSHVWSSSLLTVRKADGTIENWKTTQIVNMSKLGKLFNQWPTRKVRCDS